MIKTLYGAKLVKAAEQTDLGRQTVSLVEHMYHGLILKVVTSKKLLDNYQVEKEIEFI